MLRIKVSCPRMNHGPEPNIMNREMSGRRPHKKSRTGCQTCKQRRIKCDEAHPQCLNCASRGVTCDYVLQSLEAFKPGSSPKRLNMDAGNKSGLSDVNLSVSQSFNSFRQKSLDIFPPSTLSGNSHFLELRLMHFYTAFTSKTLTISGRDQEDVWGLVVPSLAYDSPYLMNAILGLSTLHLRSMHPEDRSLARVSHEYMATALAQYKPILSARFDVSNAEALFVTSSIIALYATASRLFTAAGLGRSAGGRGYELPHEWFEAYQGVKAVLLASWKCIRNSPRVLPIILSQPAISLELSPNRHQFFSSLLDGVDAQLETVAESERADTRKAYEHAIAFLNLAHEIPNRNLLMGFAAIVSRRFVHLLADLDPRTLVILGCFFAMMKAVDNIWWLRGVAERETLGIFNLLPNEWRGKMQWAMKVSSAESPLDEDIWGGPVQLVEAQDCREVDGDIRSHIDYLVSILPNFQK